MSKSVYQKFESSFSNVSAYVIMKDGEHVANITLKYPKDGMGRLQCYIHILGTEMQNSYSCGYGYDKTSHAIHVTAKKYLDIVPHNQKLNEKDVIQFIQALSNDEADSGWGNVLYNNGFTKINVI